MRDPERKFNNYPRKADNIRNRHPAPLAAPIQLTGLHRAQNGLTLGLQRAYGGGGAGEIAEGCVASSLSEFICKDTKKIRHNGHFVCSLRSLAPRFVRLHSCEEL